MTSYEAAILSCRILALYILFQALSAIGQIPMAVGTLGLLGHFIRATNASSLFYESLLYSYIIPSIVGLASSAVLWFAAPWLAVRIGARATTGDVVSSTRLGELQTVALMLIGVVIIAVTVPDAVKVVVNAVLQTSSSDQVTEGVRPGMTPEYWALIIRLALGVWLIFGTAAVSKSLDKMRGVETIGVK